MYVIMDYFLIVPKNKTFFAAVTITVVTIFCCGWVGWLAVFLVGFLVVVLFLIAAELLIVSLSKSFMRYLKNKSIANSKN